jgi:hypothetical protein
LLVHVSPDRRLLKTSQQNLDAQGRRTVR